MDHGERVTESENQDEGESDDFSNRRVDMQKKFERRKQSEDLTYRLVRKRDLRKRNWMDLCKSAWVEI